MDKYLDFIHNFCERYLKPKNRKSAFIGSALSIGIPFVSIMLLSIFVFTNSFPLIIYFILYGFTFMQVTIYFNGEIQKFKNQDESERRKSSDNFIFYRIKNSFTGKWEKWFRINLEDGWDDYYKNFLIPGEKQGVVEIDRGGLTNTQKKKIKRTKSIDKLIK